MAAQKSLNEDYKSDGKWKEIWRRFKKNKGAVIGLVLLVVLTVILVGAPLFISNYTEYGFNACKALRRESFRQRRIRT